MPTARRQPFYLTTTLPYVNSEPHIGFALEIIQADAICRYHRLLGEEVIFNTGTDEHGLKIYRKALEEGRQPQEYCDEYAAKFDALKDALNLTYTHFIRTTDSHHIKAAQEFWKRCAAKGDIYKKAYQVKYCVGCELEKTESDLNEDGRCPVHPAMEIEALAEENYFFRFSKYQQPLLALYEKCEDFVLPAHRLTEIQKFTEGGLEDFSVSRLKTKMPWGVPVPGDSDHVMYVWFDALINYISTLGWPDNEKTFTRFWGTAKAPRTVQIAGKDNLRQQSNMWQGMLMSAGLPPSRQILIHGFITSGGQKMSKSVGNVVDPFEVVKKYGVDPLRFYLLREIPTAEDGDFNEARYDVVYDELANGLGNLLSRVVAMTEKYFEAKVPEGAGQGTVTHIWGTIDVLIQNFDLKQAIETIWTVVNEANEYIEQQKPWALAKAGDQTTLSEVMYRLLETLRQLSWMLEPFIPETAQKMRDQLGVKETGDKGLVLREWGRLKPGTKVKKGEPLFPKRMV